MGDSELRGHLRVTALGLLAALSSACAGDGKWRCSDGEEPGYGTLGLSFVMGDAYTESVKEEMDGQMFLSIRHVVLDVEDCEDYRLEAYDYVTALTVSLDMVKDFSAPYGSTCALTYGRVHADGDPGHDIGCVGYLEPTVVKECSRVDATIEVTCDLMESPDTGV